MLGFHPISSAPLSGRKATYVAAGGGIDAVVTVGQGSQSVAAVAALTLNSTVAVGQGSQSVAAAAALTLNSTVAVGQGSQSVAAVAALTLNSTVAVGQGSQSVAAAAALTLNSTVTVGQGSQSVAAVAALTLNGVVTVGQGSQSVAAVADFAVPGALNSVVTVGQGSQSVTAIADFGIPVTPPVTGGGGIYILPGDQSEHRSEPSADRHYVPIRREPFEVKLKPPGEDLKALRDRLYELGRLLKRNKEKVKNRIRAEQAAQGQRLDATSPERLLIIQNLIAEYELDLYNQNAARLLILLAETN